ncbi:YlzJ-like family protein [Oceanobacillus sp. FSL K6-2867]|uniref:YlzJ-like family protein n=1 Tax=Oceanobacillus sp. FSL K6-2867 TaxID=2954748 RepID=UPI0030D8F8E5
MILYTPLTQHDIFPVDQEGYSNMEHIAYDGRMIYAKKTKDGSYQIQQLVSTDPQDYLRDEFSPGSTLG